jgi:hypothetical protein
VYPDPFILPCPSASRWVTSPLRHTSFFRRFSLHSIAHILISYCTCIWLRSPEGLAWGEIIEKAQRRRCVHAPRCSSPSSALRWPLGAPEGSSLIKKAISPHYRCCTNLARPEVCLHILGRTQCTSKISTQERGANADIGARIEAVSSVRVPSLRQVPTFTWMRPTLIRCPLARAAQASSIAPPRVQGRFDESRAIGQSKNLLIRCSYGSGSGGRRFATY